MRYVTRIDQTLSRPSNLIEATATKRESSTPVVLNRKIPDTTKK